jgi:hypothetical protein
MCARDPLDQGDTTMCVLIQCWQRSLASMLMAALLMAGAAWAQAVDRQVEVTVRDEPRDEELRERLDYVQSEEGPEARHLRQNLREELRELDLLLRQSDGRGREDERARRMRHVRAAIENLHAAGLPDQAQRLERELERLAREDQGDPNEPGEEGEPGED